MPQASDYTERMLVLIVAGVKDLANLQAARVAEGAGNTFVAGLSPDGREPFTHYWCNWLMTASERASFVNYLEALANSGRAWLYDAELVTTAEVLAEHGLQPARPFP